MSKTIFDFVRPEVHALVPYKGGKPISEAQRELNITSFIKLASNECPYPTDLAVRKAIAVAAMGIHEYPDGNAYTLKQLLAKKHGVTPQQITLGNGSSEVLELLVLAFTDSLRKDSLLATKHAFLVYKLLTSVHGLSYKETPLANWRADLQQLIGGLDDTVRLVCLANPANPIGTAVENADLKACIANVPATTLFVLDQAYADFYPHSDAALEWLANYPNLVITRTFSKASGLAGLRVGYSISSPEIADFLNRVRQPFNLNSLAQVAAVAALQDEHSLQRTITNNAEYRARLYALCAELGIATLPSEANFVTLDFDTADRATYMEKALLQQGIIVRGLANYQLPSMLRITIGMPEQMEQLFASLTSLSTGSNRCD